MMQRSIVLAGCLLLASAAYGQKVSVESDSATDLDSLKTFAWRPETPQTAARTADQEAMLATLKRAVEETLSRKGLRLVAVDEAQIQIAMHGGVFDQLMGSAWKVQLGKQVSYGPDESLQGTLKSYQEGVLVVDLYDTSQDKVVWSGTGVTKISGPMAPVELRKRGDKLARKIMSRY